MPDFVDLVDFANDSHWIEWTSYRRIELWLNVDLIFYFTYYWSCWSRLEFWRVSYWPLGSGMVKWVRGRVFFPSSQGYLDKNRNIELHFSQWDLKILGSSREESMFLMVKVTASYWHDVEYNMQMGPQLSFGMLRSPTRAPVPCCLPGCHLSTEPAERYSLIQRMAQGRCGSPCGVAHSPPWGSSAEKGQAPSSRRVECHHFLPKSKMYLSPRYFSHKLFLHACAW